MLPLTDAGDRLDFSANGKYLAVTVTFTATSQEQLDALYRELSQHSRVVMLL